MLGVQELSDKDFSKDKNGNLRPVQPNIVIMYYAPWCHWCTKLKPIYKDFAKEYTKRNTNNAASFKIAALDCESNKEIANGLDLEGFPTIILYSGGTKVEYQGDRTKDAMVEFVESNHPSAKKNAIPPTKEAKPVNKPQAASDFFAKDSGVLVLTDKNFDTKAKTLVGIKGPVIILYYAPWCYWCNQIKPVWNDLAALIKKDPTMASVTVAALDCTKYPVVCDFAGVDGYPSIKLYNKAEVSSEVPYFGERTVPAIQAFVQKKVSSNVAIPNRQADSTVSPLVAGKPAFLCFYDPQNAESMRVRDNVLPSVMQKFQKYVRIGAIDSTKYGDITRKMNITKVPTCVLVNDDKITPFNKSATLADISQFLYDKVVLSNSKHY